VPTGSVFLVLHWPLLCPMFSRHFKILFGLNKLEKDWNKSKCLLRWHQS